MPKESQIVAHAKRVKMQQERMAQSDERVSPNVNSVPAEEAEKNNENNMEELISVPLSELQPDPNQARHNFSKISELQESIRLNGQLQPIIVIKNEEGQFVIKDGECRWRAMKLLAEEQGKDLSSVKIRAVYKYEALDENIGLILNLLRNDYSPFEMAFAIQKLQKSDPTLTLEQIGRYIGKSRQNVGEYLNLLRLPIEVRNDAIANNLVPFYQLKQLAANPRLSETEKIEEYNKLLASHSQEALAADKEPLKAETAIAPKKKETNSLNRKLNAIHTKLDSLIKSFEKFHANDMSDEEARRELAEKLDIIISRASELKSNLDGENL